MARSAKAYGQRDESCMGFEISVDQINDLKLVDQTGIALSSEREAFAD